MQLQVTEWSADVAAFERRSVRAGQRVKLETRGWTGAGDTLYIHYVRNGKAVRSEKLGALKGPCGDLTKSFRAFAFRSAKPGTYDVRFSAEATWDKRRSLDGLQAREAGRIAVRRGRPGS